MSDCSICMLPWNESILKYPRVLDCGHTFCLDCLNKCIAPDLQNPVADKRVGVKCFNCRELTTCASLNSLRKNYALIDLTKLRNEEKLQREESQKGKRKPLADISNKSSENKIKPMKYEEEKKISLEFNEKEYDSFKIEKPDIALIKSQAAATKCKELNELSIQHLKGSVQNPNNDPVLEGYGYYRYNDNTFFEGKWKDGKRHGFGYLNNGEQKWEYIGNFEDNIINGFGKYIWGSGDKYVGSFVQNEKTGFGIYKWANGACYQGEWKYNQRHGLGIYTYPDGSSYYGYYYLDKPDGIGTYVWPDGNFYSGEWKNGIRCGLGYFKWAKNNAYYIGNFKNNYLEGKGSFFYEDGSYYKGEFRRNKRDGFGKCMWADKSCYIGHWSNGEKNGAGKMIENDGRVIEDVWCMGKRLKYEEPGNQHKII